jgi:murein tripeptide amidase MpaA
MLLSFLVLSLSLVVYTVAIDQVTFSSSSTSSTSFIVRYDGDKLIRLFNPSYELKHELLSTELYDVWSVAEEYMDVRMTSSGYKAFLNTKEDFAIKYEVVVENVQELIDSERNMISTLSESSSEEQQNWFENYHTYDEIKEWYKSLAEEYKDLVEYVASIGESHEGRELFALHLTSNNNNNNNKDQKKPQVYFQCQIHAREWISGATGQYLVYNLLSKYGKDERITELLDNVEFIVVPIVNPDGYDYTWKGERLWRKNRRKNGGFSMGVDLNRNFNVHWEEKNGASSSPWAETYKGPEVCSEPETKAIVSYFLKHKGIVGAIDFHVLFLDLFM